MAPTLTRQLVRVAVSGNKSEPGCLVFADGVLVAVISHLEETVDGEIQHRWYLEAGFGRCDGLKPEPVFASKDEAQAWVAGRLEALISSEALPMAERNDDTAGRKQDRKPDSTGTNSRPRDETIAQTGPGIPDDTSQQVEISPEEEKNIEKSIRSM